MIEQQRAIAVTWPLKSMTKSPREFVREFMSINDGETCWYAKVNAVPKQEVLYCYIIIDNRVRYRANIVGFEQGCEMTFDDGRTATAKKWMILGAPVVKAPHKIEMTGFQGFRYTRLLW